MRGGGVCSEGWGVCIERVECAVRGGGVCSEGWWSVQSVTAHH